jgi:hypothetical protein
MIDLCKPAFNGGPCRLKNTILHEMLHTCATGGPGVGAAQHAEIYDNANEMYPCPPQFIR